MASTPADAPARDEAIAALHDVRRSIDELADIAGRLARSAVDDGASWDDVGASLRLCPDVAEKAYRAP